MNTATSETSRCDALRQRSALFAHVCACGDPVHWLANCSNHPRYGASPAQFDAALGLALGDHGAIYPDYGLRMSGVFADRGGRALCFLEPSRPDKKGDQVKYWDRG